MGSVLLSRHVYFPVAEALKRVPVSRALRDLRRSQWRSADEIRKHAAARLSDLIEGAREEVPHYARKLSGLAHTCASTAMEALQDIPILTKAQAIEEWDALRAARPGRVMRGRTSGSCGQALEFAFTPEFLAYTEAAQWRGRSWWGMRRGHPMVTLWGRSISDAQVAARIARRERWRNWLRISAFELNRQDLARSAAAISRFAPRFLYGYSSAIYQLALHCSENDLPPPPGLEAVFYTADALLGFQRRLVEEALRAPAACEYGSSEAGAFAFECREGGVHIASENVVVEIVRGGIPVSEGEEGEVVVTALRNRAMPLIRYNLGDWARIVPGRCACGRQLPLIQLTNTKVVDLVRTSRGSAASGHLFDYILIALIDQGVRGIRQFFVIQKSLDSFVVQVVPGPGLGPECLDLFEGMMRERLGRQIEVQFEIVPQIAREAGKIRYFRCDIPVLATARVPALQAAGALEGAAARR